MENQIVVDNTKKYIYPSMTKVLNQFNHLYNLCHFSIGLVPGYYDNYDSLTRRDYFKEQVETLKCEMTLKSIDKLKALADQLKIAGRNKLEALSIRPIDDNYKFCLEMIGTDIEPNFDLIVKILKTAEQYL